jgi:hypothetical protein
VEVRAKKVLEEKLRREMIERDNQTLVDRIGHIMTHKVTVCLLAVCCVGASLTTVSGLVPVIAVS